MNKYLLLLLCTFLLIGTASALNSTGKPYEKSLEPHASYLDTGNAEFTDGILPSNAYDDSGWFATQVIYYAPAENITINLGEPQRIYNVSLWAFSYTDGGIALPHTTIWGSNDNVTFTKIGMITYSEGNSSTQKAILGTLTGGIDEVYQYVRYEFVVSNFEWVWVGEGMVDYNSTEGEACEGVYLDGVRAYYRFNETNGTIIDSAGLYNISSVTGSITQGVVGKLGRAINFTDGYITSDYQNCSGVPMTINFWAYSVDGEHRVFISEDNAGFDPLIQYTGSEYSFSIGNQDGGTATISGSSIITNEWVMLTGVVLANRTAYFYENATLVGTGYAGWDGSCHNYYIGGYDGSNFKHNERLDEVMFFAKALNQSEISALYNSAQSCYVTLAPIEEPEEINLSIGLLHYWNADDNYNDLFGTNNGTNYGTINGTGKIKYGWWFDGVDDYVNVGNIGYLDGTNNFTMWMWVNTTNYGFYDISTMFQTSSYGGIAWNIGTGGGKQCFGSVGINEICSTDTTNLNETTLVSVVYDTDNNLIYFYKNGVLDSGSPISYGSTFNTGDNWFGWQGVDGLQFAGMMDEIGISSVAFNTEMQEALYDGGNGWSPTFEEAPEEPQEPEEPETSTGQAIYTLLDSSGAGLGIFFGFLALAIPSLSIGLGLVVIIFIIASAIQNSFKHFNFSKIRGGYHSIK